MSRVDFYILSQAGTDACAQFSCRLTSKAVTLNHTVHIRTDDGADAKNLDELLWTFQDESFLPHELWNGTTREAPVTIAEAAAQPPTDAEVIINLADSPAPTGTWRIAEIVGADEPARSAGRSRFAHYRDAGLEIDTHKL
ncbi:MAG: DNA polymerase III subunit chi [Pseudomonadota bacterium]